MRALILPLLGSSASMACGFAAVGLALYAPQHGQSAATLYGGFGAVAGLVCGVVDLAWHRLPTAARLDAESAQAQQRAAVAVLADHADHDGPGSA